MSSDLSGVPLLSDPDPGPGELGGGGHRGHGEAGDHVQSGEARPQAGQGLGVATADADHLRHDALLLILVSKNRIEMQHRFHLKSYLALRSANVSLSCSSFPFLNLMPDLLASMML